MLNAKNKAERIDKKLNQGETSPSEYVDVFRSEDYVAYPSLFKVLLQQTIFFVYRVNLIKSLIVWIVSFSPRLKRRLKLVALNNNLSEPSKIKHEITVFWVIWFHRNSGLAHIVKVLLSRFTWFKNWLKCHDTIPAHAQSQSRTPSCFYSGSDDLSTLPPNARRIYLELKQAIAKKQAGNH